MRTVAYASQIYELFLNYTPHLKKFTLKKFTGLSHKLLYGILVYMIYIMYICNIKQTDMATALNIKRKNIDLPVDTLQKLSIMAAAQGKSLKNYIETVLISKANSISIEVTENPSPSGDTWFNDPENMSSVKRGIEEMEAGKVRAYSMDEIKNILGV